MRRLNHLQDVCQVPPMPLRYPFMSRDEVVRLSGGGFDVEPHGDTHCSLRAETPARVMREVQDAAAFTRSVTQREPCCFAWPYGHVPATRSLAESALASAGLSAAVVVTTGLNDHRADLLALRRWDIHGGYSLDALQARLSGFSALLRPEDPT